MSSRERHDKPLKRLGSYLRSRVPRRLATDAESAKSPPRREDGAEASGQVADPPRIPGSDLPYRATNGTCKVELRSRQWGPDQVTPKHPLSTVMPRGVPPIRLVAWSVPAGC